MLEHSEVFLDWESEARKVKDELGNKINRMSKGAIEEEVEINYLAKILVEIFLDEKDEDLKKAKKPTYGDSSLISFHDGIEFSMSFNLLSLFSAITESVNRFINQTTFKENLSASSPILFHKRSILP